MVKISVMERGKWYAVWSMLNLVLVTVRIETYVTRTRSEGQLNMNKPVLLNTKS